MSLSAALFASAGTAQATDPTYFYNSDNSMQVIYGGGGGTIFATIVDLRNPEGATEFCQYHAVGVQGTPTFPYTAKRRSPGRILGADSDRLTATRRTLLPST